MDKPQSRTCDKCRQTKLFNREEWKWAARYGAYGRLCKICDRDKYREAKKKAARKYHDSRKNAKVTIKEQNKEIAALKKRLRRMEELFRGL